MPSSSPLGRHVDAHLGDDASNLGLIDRSHAGSFGLTLAGKLGALGLALRASDFHLFGGGRRGWIDRLAELPSEVGEGRPRCADQGRPPLRLMPAVDALDELARCPALRVDTGVGQDVAEGTDVSRSAGSIEQPGESSSSHLELALIAVYEPGSELLKF